MKYLFNSEIKINNSILESFAYNIKYLKDGMDDDYLNEFDPSYKDNLIRFNNKALELYNSSSTAINDLNFENLFLDFNYSKNIENYIKTLNSQNKDSKPRCFGKSKLIKIHGEASNHNNVINFGFGDEMDSNYKTIENINDNRFLDNIKSFMYLNNSNYRDLLNWIENNDFQVFIMGHSCGLSDRTLLNTIFEHHNCKSIKIYYHQINNEVDNFSDIVKNISRHFNKKALMRNKLVNKSICKPLPQDNKYEIIK